MIVISMFVVFPAACRRVGLPVFTVVRKECLAGDLAGNRDGWFCIAD